MNYHSRVLFCIDSHFNTICKFKSKLRYTLHFYSIFIFIILFYTELHSQVENLQISHPVYRLLERMESRGFLPNMSLNDLPLQRKQIIEALKLIQNNFEKLNSAEIQTLEGYLIEFGINPRTNRVLFASSTDSTQILFDGLWSNSEKFIYKFNDSIHSVSFLPLASADIITMKNDDGFDKAIIGHLGFRLFGTLGNSLGYNLRVTNGSFFSGNKELTKIDRQYYQNIKFSQLNSDIDYTESHLRFQSSWFYAGIGREHRLTGAGYNNRLIMSDNSPAFDALTLGARIKSFEYKFTHSSLLALPQTYFGWETGPNIEIIPKYLVTHRFSFRPEWGEVSFWENIVYSGRYYDLAYLNPLSFLKSLEHSLRDRDNSGIGVDATIRIVDGVQLKGTYFMDDVIFSNIGTGYWGNKAAWNIGLMYSPDLPIDFGIEYVRVEPFTFSHFNIQNSMTNDGYILSSYLQPNSDRISFFGKYWWGSRYPLEFNFSYQRHGKNVYDEDGNLIKNVGGSALQTARPEDPYDGYFLTDGIGEYISSFDLKGGFELVRGFNLQLMYKLLSVNDNIDNYFRFILRFDEF